jgi:hypothetical protein
MATWLDENPLPEVQIEDLDLSELGDAPVGGLAAMIEQAPTLAELAGQSPKP